MCVHAHSNSTFHYKEFRSLKLYKRKNSKSWACSTPCNLGPWKAQQEDSKFKDSVRYVIKFCLKTKVKLNNPQ